MVTYPKIIIFPYNYNHLNCYEHVWWFLSKSESAMYSVYRRLMEQKYVWGFLVPFPYFQFLCIYKNCPKKIWRLSELIQLPSDRVLTLDIIHFIVNQWLLVHLQSIFRMEWQLLSLRQYFLEVHSNVMKLGFPVTNGARTSEQEFQLKRCNAKKAFRR